ncbi:hypothetical protein CEXT_603461 [Caerostris extrusa]|uniref:Uncharacterized protein n=1 Tax=Caerostris extrusa TaxID=172846 RepID=A0AAV4PT45_CAEEX|nr:hypothetical protein CEXT_603461 [Caerostris extrusa]
MPNYRPGAHTFSTNDFLKGSGKPGTMVDPGSCSPEHLSCEAGIVKRYFLRSFFHILLLLLLLIRTALQTPPHQVKCPLAPFVLDSG